MSTDYVVPEEVVYTPEKEQSTEINLFKENAIKEITLDVLSKDSFIYAYDKLISSIEVLTALQKQVNEKAKEVIKEEYLKSGKTTVATDKFRFTYVPESYPKRFSASDFKEANEEEYNKYVKESVTSESLRITRVKERK